MSRHSIKDFDPIAVAAYDAQMLKAYYSHRFFKLFVLLIKMFREQFGVGFITSVWCAFYLGRAVVNFRTKEDHQLVLKYFTKYYQLVKKSTIEDFDSVKCAKSELNWALVHRYPKKYKQSLEDAVIQVKVDTYGVPAKKLKDFGKYYVTGTNIRDKATHVDHVEPDWEVITQNFKLAYKSLHSAVN